MEMKVMKIIWLSLSCPPTKRSIKCTQTLLWPVSLDKAMTISKMLAKGQLKSLWISWSPRLKNCKRFTTLCRKSLWKTRLSAKDNSWFKQQTSWCLWVITTSLSSKWKSCIPFATQLITTQWAWCRSCWKSLTTMVSQSYLKYSRSLHPSNQSLILFKGGRLLIDNQVHWHSSQKSLKFSLLRIEMVLARLQLSSLKRSLGPHVLHYLR